MSAIATAVSEADRAEAYNRMQPGRYVLAAVPDFQFKWMERTGDANAHGLAIKVDVIDPAVLAVLNENPSDWAGGRKPERTPTTRIIGCNNPRMCEDALRALVALGYTQRQAKRALDGISGSTAEDLVRGALARLSNTSPQQPVDPKATTRLLPVVTAPAQVVGYAD